MSYRYPSPKKALDSILASNSAAKTASILGVHRANIYHYLGRYKKKRVPPVVKEAIVTHGLAPVTHRIRSQITWESEDQRDAFMEFIHDQNYASVTEYCRAIGNIRLKFKPVSDGWKELWRE